jgi:hypothetical protein
VLHFLPFFILQFNNFGDYNIKFAFEHRRNLIITEQGRVTVPPEIQMNCALIGAAVALVVSGGLLFKKIGFRCAVGLLSGIYG